MTRARRALLVLVPCVAGLGPPAALAGTGTAVPLQTPFETPLPWSLEGGECEVAAGAAFRSGARPPFFSGEPGAARDEWRLDLVDAALGAGGGAEARVQFGLQRVEDEAGETTSGIQDARLTFSYLLPLRRPALALGTSVKLPNASGERRLGTDQTDVTLLASAGARGPWWGLAASAGLRILGSPREAGVQDDVLAFGAAGWIGPRRRETPGEGLALFGEVFGQAASRFGNDERVARAGVTLTRRATVALSVRRGLTSVSEDWGVEARIGVIAPVRRGRS